jgi:hypothetical protein
VKLPRLRIAWLMAIVAMAALHFGAVRAGLEVRRHLSTPIIDLLGVGALPMANVLAVRLLVGDRRRGSRSFLLGVEAFGAAALVACIAVASLYPNEMVMPYILMFLGPLTSAIGGLRSISPVVVFLSIAGVSLGLPQLGFALLGDFLCRKFKIGERPG